MEKCSGITQHQVAKRFALILSLFSYYSANLDFGASIVQPVYVHIIYNRQTIHPNRRLVLGTLQDNMVCGFFRGVSLAGR